MTTRSKSGMSPVSVVCLVFVTLKLAGVAPVAQWSWWWVAAPLWVTAGAVIASIALLGLIAIAVAWADR